MPLISLSEIEEIRLTEIATPSDPASGYGVIYIKSDGKLYRKNGSTETAIEGIASYEAIQMLASITAGMQTADGAQTIYTVPTGYELLITHVIVSEPTASLAGGTDYDFTGFRTGITLAAMTSTSHYTVINGQNGIYSVQAAATAIQITPNTGSTADADATIELYGRLRTA